MSNYDSYLITLITNVLKVFPNMTTGIYKHFIKEMAIVASSSSDHFSALSEVLQNLTGIDSSEVRKKLLNAGIASHQEFLNALMKLHKIREKVRSERQDAKAEVIPPSNIQDYLKAEYTRRRGLGWKEDEAKGGAAYSAHAAYKGRLLQEGFDESSSNAMARSVINRETNIIWGKAFMHKNSGYNDNKSIKEDKFKKLYIHYRRQGYSHERAQKLAAYHAYGTSYSRNPDEGTVASGPEGVNFVRMLALKGALKLEIKGMKRRGMSAHAIIKQEFGLKGSKEKVLKEFEKIIEAAGATLPPGSIQSMKSEAQERQAEPAEREETQFEENPKPSQYIVVHATTMQPLGVVKSPKSNINIRGKKMSVLKIDRDIIYSLPEKEAKKYKDNSKQSESNPRNPMEGGTPYLKDDSFYDSIRKQYPHLEKFSNEQIDMMLHQQSIQMPQMPQMPFYQPAPMMYPQIQQPIVPIKYKLFHSNNGLYIGTVDLAKVPVKGEWIVSGVEDLKVEEIRGNKLLVHPRRLFKYAAVALVKKGMETTPNTVFDVIPTHNRRDAIAMRHRLKFKMKKAGYKLRGGDTKVIIVAWSRLSKYIPELT